MHWDWSVNLGNVLAAGVLFGGFIAAHIQNVRNIQDIRTKVDLIYKWFEKKVINRGDEIA